ncbi:MAG: hypothetical protein AAGH15_20905, partial [Myxococcota bacterium]
MPSLRLSRLLPFLVLALAACGDDDGPPADAGMRDLGADDAGVDLGADPGEVGAGGFVVNQLLILPEGFQALAAFAE